MLTAATPARKVEATRRSSTGGPGAAASASGGRTAPARRDRAPVGPAELAVLTVGALLTLRSLGARSGPGRAPRWPRAAPRPALRVDRSCVTHARTPPPTARGRRRPASGCAVKLKLPRGQRGSLFNVRTGRGAVGPRTRRAPPIASLTKMMTALIVAAHAPHDHVMITPPGGALLRVRGGAAAAGQARDAAALLYGLLLPSGNDAAIALAQHVAGTQDRFVALMNRQARRLQLRCTHLRQPVRDRRPGQPLVRQRPGRPGPRSARAARCWPGSSARGARSCASRSRAASSTSTTTTRCCVPGYPGTDGVKTGFTAAAGPCLVATARRGGPGSGSCCCTRSTSRRGRRRC